MIVAAINVPHLLQAYALKAGEPTQRSGQQEHYENMLNYYVWGAYAAYDEQVGGPSWRHPSVQARSKVKLILFGR